MPLGLARAGTARAALSLTFSLHLSLSLSLSLPLSLSHEHAPRALSPPRTQTSLHSAHRTAVAGTLTGTPRCVALMSAAQSPMQSADQDINAPEMPANAGQAGAKGGSMVLAAVWLCVFVQMLGVGEQSRARR